MSGASSPGSTIIASLVVRQPAMKQFSWERPGRESPLGSSCSRSGMLDLFELLDVQHEDDGAAHAHLQRLGGRQAARERQRLDGDELLAHLALGADHRQHVVDGAGAHAREEDGRVAATQEAAGCC